jgi:hypothetical protein
MAFPPHIQIAIKMLPHLVECAKTGRRTNYQELGAAIKMESRMFSRPLAFIRDEICTRHNLPPLTVLVENKGKDVPGNSFAPAALTSMTPADYKILQEQMLQKVYTYDRWDRALAALNEMYCAA